MKDFMNLYSNLVSRCFDDCVNDFTSNSLTSKKLHVLPNVLKILET